MGLYPAAQPADTVNTIWHRNLFGETGMNFNWKHKTAVLALSAAMLSASAGAQVAPVGKPVQPPVEVVQPAPSVDVETGQLLDKGPRWPHKVERTSGTPPPVDCGLTGRVASGGPGGGPRVSTEGGAQGTEKPGRPKIRDKPVSTRSTTGRVVPPAPAVVRHQRQRPAGRRSK